jgi:hypothetical protein
MHDDRETARQMRRMRAVGPLETTGPSPSTPREKPSDETSVGVPLGLAVRKVIDAADVDGLLERRSGSSRS